MKIRIDEGIKLDEICLNNIRVKKIDIQKIKKQQVTFFACHDEDDKYYETTNGERFLYIAIEKVGCITSLKAGIGKYKNPYCKVQLNVRRPGIGNLIGFTVDEYWKQIEFAKEILWEVYGILLDFSEATIQSIEINRTFKTKHPFNDYYRVLTLLCKIMPKIHLRSPYENDEDFESITGWTRKGGNRSESYKKVSFYDKKSQINNLICLDDEVMRFEIKLVGKRNIERNLKVESSSELTFGELTQERIEQWYEEQVEKIVTKPFEKWEKERNQQLIQLMIDERERDIRHWQTNVLRELQNEEIKQRKPTLLDIEELLQCVEKLDLTNKRRSDVRNNFRKQAYKHEKAFCNNDHLKLTEVLDKLTAKHFAING